MFKTLAKSSLVHVAVGFLLMGGWALFANSGHGLAKAWLPALVQGTISGLLTGALKKTLEALDGKVPGALAYVAPPALTAGTILALLFAVHTLIGTPEVVRTIAFPWTLSTLYAIVYNARLVKERRAAA
jgi:hypothetical protein